MQACAPVDVNNPVTVKNNNELLRCFAVVSMYTLLFKTHSLNALSSLSLLLSSSPLAKSHSNRVVAFLLQKLEVSQEKVRLATLNVIKHLINSCDAELEDKKPLLISGLNIILHEQNLKVGLQNCQLYTLLVKM